MKKCIIVLVIIAVIGVVTGRIVWLNNGVDYDLVLDSGQYENARILRQYNNQAIKRSDMTSVVNFLNDIPLCEDRKNTATQKTPIYNIKLQNKNATEESYQIRAGEDNNYYLRIIKDNGENIEQYMIKDNGNFITYADEYFEKQ